MVYVERKKIFPLRWERAYRFKMVGYSLNNLLMTFFPPGPLKMAINNNVRNMDDIIPSKLMD
jgi:hypothetical protein